ncbi:MAG TPA: BTAD domain-containing putative transcriptional regulator [Acidimicrobiia bacterium]|nr:BTAD domain-containing putative transcriptional regulator [Acidimicrobiia bacterium]
MGERVGSPVRRRGSVIPDDLDIAILGPVQVRRADAPVELKGAKRGRILAMLAAECGRPVSVDRLVTALWTDPPKTATKTVRVQVGEIRRRLQADDGKADPIVTRPGGYQLEVAPHQVDLHRFVALVRQGGELLRSGAAEQAGDRYRDALALWQEPPLPSFADVPAFSPLVAEVEGLALAAREGTLLTRLELRQHRPLLAEVDALLAREPLREELYAIAMLAMYREGRQADALALFQRARGILAEELGVEPSERLRDLELAILDQRDDLLDEGDSRAIGRFSTTGSFVGRSRELVALGDAWQRAQRGRGSLVLVTGEPGVGKTRLAHELADQLHATGAAQAWANAAATSTAPLGAVASWLEQLGALDAAADQATGGARQQLSVLPDDDPELDSGRGRHQRLIDAVISALREVSARRPVLLVLDDLHQADHATAALLLQLGQVIDRLPVLVVGTQRSTEADQGPGLAAVLPELLRIDATHRLPLAPLDREETGRLPRRGPRRDPARRRR